jgi:hypothetical protein
MKFEIVPPYTPVTELPYCCVPAVLQMILKRRGLPYPSQAEIGYQLGLIVPPELKHHFTRVRTGPEPKTGYGTRTSEKPFSITRYFRKNNLPLKLTLRQPDRIHKLGKYLTDALSCNDDVIICYNSRLLFGDGDPEHVALIQSFDNETNRIWIIDPAIGMPTHRGLNLKKLSDVLYSDPTGEQKGLWIIEGSGPFIDQSAARVKPVDVDLSA